MVGCDTFITDKPNSCAYCFPGYYLGKLDESVITSPNICRECIENCYSCDKNSCKRCFESYYLRKQEGTNNDLILACKNCPVGCEECADEITCSKCMIGFYLPNENSVCEMCPKNCRECRNVGGSFYPGGVQCLICDQGSQFDFKGKRCVNEERNYFDFAFIFSIAGGIYTSIFIFIFLLMVFRCGFCLREEYSDEHKNISFKTFDL